MMRKYDTETKKQLNRPMEERKSTIELFDIIKWRSKGRGVVSQKTGYVISFVPAGTVPELSIEHILELIRLEELPDDAEWSQTKYRQIAMPKPTFIAWSFFKDIKGNVHHGFYRPMSHRATIVKSNKSIKELYHEETNKKC